MRNAITLLSASLSLGLVACVPPQDDDRHPVAQALPTADDVRIDLPESDQAKAVSAAVGDLSPWYVVTRNVTRDLNGGTAWVLIVVHAIVQYPPTSVEGNTATWGPWSDALDPAEYRLVVTELANGTYDWSLDGKSKTVADAEFETVISGNAIPGETDGTGRGDFTIDFDAAERVNPVDNDAAGVVAIYYDLAARHLDMAVSTADGNFDYSYDEESDGAGDMVFAIHADTDDEGAAAEDAVIRSRWLATGAGRSDVRLSGGDLADQQVTASECWDTTFRVVFYSDSVAFLPPAGEESSCAFATSDLPPL
jgi:hypothetical protein